MKDICWVVVANSAQARIFSLENLQTLSEIEDLVHPESHLHDQDVVDGQPGRSFDSTGSHRHAIEPKTSQKELSLERFGRSLSNFLEKKYRASAFSRLYIVASPAFLGVLRQMVSADVARVVEKEISKDIVRCTKPEILAVIFQ